MNKRKQELAGGKWESLLLYYTHLWVKCWVTSPATDSNDRGRGDSLAQLASIYAISLGLPTCKAPTGLHSDCCGDIGGFMSNGELLGERRDKMKETIKLPHLLKRHGQSEDLLGTRLGRALHN